MRGPPGYDGPAGERGLIGLKVVFLIHFYVPSSFNSIKVALFYFMQGYKGAIGPRGPPGRDAPVITIEGQKGDQGYRGIPGRDGRPCENMELLSGPPGRPGYQVRGAIVCKYHGSRITEVFRKFAWLQGPRGPKGERGERGVEGLPVSLLQWICSNYFKLI